MLKSQRVRQRFFARGLQCGFFAFKRRLKRVKNICFKYYFLHNDSGVYGMAEESLNNFIEKSL